MTIGICDDETYILKQLEKAINSYFTTKEVPLEILIFHSGEEVIANTVQMDMLFLDIEMTGIDGIATGELLRERQKCCKIVMATGKVERFKEAFRIQAFRFITGVKRRKKCILKIEHLKNTIHITWIVKEDMYKL